MGKAVTDQKTNPGQNVRLAKFHEAHSLRTKILRGHLKKRF